MTLPATVGELLALAENEVAAFSDHVRTSSDPQLGRVLRAWPRFREASRSALATTVGPRVPTHPVDYAVAVWTKPRDPQASSLMAGSGSTALLLRTAALVGAAGDLIAQVDPPAVDAHAAAARIASVVATAAHSLISVTERASNGEGTDLVSVVHTQMAAAKILDAHARRDTRSALDYVAAEPTTASYGLAGRLAAASLAWRRETMAADPCSDVFVLSAVMSGRLHVTAWQIVEAAQRAGLAGDLPGRSCRDSFRQAALAWREVAKGWRGYVVPGHRPEALRTAAADLNATCDAVASHVAQPAPRTDVLDLAEGAARALSHVQCLATHHEQLPEQLANSGLLFVPARSLPGDIDRLHDALRGRYVAAPARAAGTLTSGFVAARRRTSTARLAVADAAAEGRTALPSACPTPSRLSTPALGFARPVTPRRG